MFEDNKNSSPEGGYVANEGKSDYVVKKNRRSDVIAYIFSLVAAIILWGYVMTVGDGGVMQVVFNSVELTYKGENELREKYGLIVQDVDEQVSITLSGDKDQLKGIDSSAIGVYVDISDITSAGEYSIELVAEIPQGLKYELSSKSVTVTIDEPTGREFAVTSENIRIKGTQLVDYPIVDKQVNISKVTLEGSSVNLDRVASIEIITDQVGQITSSMKVSASIVLLDDELNALDLPITVKTDAGRDGVEVSLTVFMEKNVKLTLSTQNGYFGDDQIKITPDVVRIKGEASLVKSVNSIPLKLETINEKELFGDKTYVGIDIERVDGLTYSTSDGDDFVGAEVSLKVSDTETRVISVSNFELFGAPLDVVIADRQIMVTVRAVSGENAAIMLRSLEEHPDKIKLYVDYSLVSADGRVAAVVVFDSEYAGYVYEVGTYSVSVGRIVPAVENADQNGNDQ